MDASAVPTAPGGGTASPDSAQKRAEPPRIGPSCSAGRESGRLGQSLVRQQQERFVNILAIDPGTTRSAWVEYDPVGRRVIVSGIDDNEELLRLPCP